MADPTPATARQAADRSGGNGSSRSWQIGVWVQAGYQRPSGKFAKNSAEGGSIYRVTWDVENEITTTTNPAWHPSRIPQDVVEQLRPVYSDLSMEIRTGLRRE